MEPMELKQEKISRLQNFPIMFYAVIMGLGGLGVAYKALHEAFGLPGAVFEVLRWTALVVFFAITAMYVAKALRHFGAVKAEFAHPIKLNFFAAFPISLFLLSALFMDMTAFHDALFYMALAIQTFLTLYIVAFWIRNNMMIQHSNPAWFIPIVGNLIVIVAARDVKSALYWYYFSVGLFFWMALFTIIFYRIIFHDQLAQKFMPTLFILIAPPAMAFLGYLKMGGGFDAFAHVLLGVTIFFVLLIVFMFRSFIGLKFFLSWWAFIFPTAAASIAFTKAYGLTHEVAYAWMGGGMFAMLCALVVVVAWHTLKNIARGEICVAE